MQKIRFSAMNLLVEPSEIEAMRQFLDPKAFGELQNWAQESQAVRDSAKRPAVVLRIASNLVWKIELGRILVKSTSQESLSYNEVRAFEHLHGLRGHSRITFVPLVSGGYTEAVALIASNVKAKRPWDAGLIKSS